MSCTLLKCVHCLSLSAPATLSLCACYQGQVFSGAPLFDVKSQSKLAFPVCTVFLLESLIKQSCKIPSQRLLSPDFVFPYSKH